MNALDKLGLAITNAGYTWTPEMRKAYEEGIKREWVGLTDEEIFEHEWWDEETAFHVNNYLKEKNNG
jgi:hypothetical protein